jgi:hypothetical protein
MRTSTQADATNSASKGGSDVDADLRGFRPSLQEFKEVVREVRDLAVAAGLGIVGLFHIEKCLFHRSHNVTRGVLQDSLNNISAEEEIRDDVIGPDGSILRYPRRRKRMLETLFGTVEISRLGYRDRGTGSVFPLDAKLNLPKTSYSHGLQELAAWLVAQGSYGSVTDYIAKYTAAKFPRRQLEAMVREFVTDFYDYYAALRNNVVQSKQDCRLLLCAGVDGKGIVTRPEDLREATKRRAEGASPKLQKRLTRGEKRNRKRMAEAAVIYDVEVHHRSAEDIILADHRSKDAPRPFNKRVWASAKQEIAQVLDELMEDVKARDPEKKRTLVILVDGLEAQIRQVYAALKRHGREDAIVIQDVFHVAEYIWRAARCFYAESDPAGEVWVNERLLEILKGNSSKVAAGMTQSATKRELSKSARADVDKAARYLIKNRVRLNYDRALEIGAPIGTGVVEGAVRHLIKARMECSGARWSLSGAEAVLQLRALRMSGDWDDYCEYHWQQEYRRNYPQYEPRRVI